MAQHPLRLDRLVYDDDADEVIFQVSRLPQEGPVPDGVHEANFYPQALPSMSFSVKAKKWPSFTPTAVAVKREDDKDCWYLYTWDADAQAWTNPRRSDDQGKLL